MNNSSAANTTWMVLVTQSAISCSVIAGVIASVINLRQAGDGDMHSMQAALLIIYF
jgi:hypothetical protein